MSRLFSILLIALLTAGLLWPSEEAYAGTGLQWAALWCGLACLMLMPFAADRLAWRYETGRTLERPIPGVFAPALCKRWSLADIGIVLVAAGQWVSTAVVFQRGGDCRSALNLSFEWAGLLAAWLLLRVALFEPRFRSLLACLLIALGTGLAAYGIWQHHFLYRAHASWYQNLRSELNQLDGKSDAAATIRTAQIVRELQQSEIPLEGTNRFLWEQRLLNSSEPTGVFALANTLGGILAVCIVLACGSMLQHLLHGRRGTTFSTIVIFGAAVVTTYCLLLTKSRTAWVGCAAGLLWLVVSQRQLHSVRWIRRLVPAVIAVGVVSIVTAIRFGGLDKEVLLESPRSLQFRMLYWMGTLETLKESPIVGTGPGNFRQSYLAHKLPESSEEIRDPHNMVLEAWTSGGLISLLGVLLCGVSFVSGFGSSGSGLNRPDPDQSPVSGDVAVSPRMSRQRRGVLHDRTLFVAVGCGFVLHAGWQWLNGVDPTWDTLSWMMIPAAVYAVLLARPERILELPLSAAQAGGLTLTVHLMGAGGFEVPAVMICLIALLACVSSQQTQVTSSAEFDELRTAGPGHDLIPWRRRLKIGLAASVRVILAVLFAGLASACVIQGVVPNWQVRQLTAAGSQLQRNGDWIKASETLRSASTLDPLSVIPRQRLADLESYRLMTLSQLPELDSGRFERQFVAAQEACDGWRQADPRNPAVFRLRASVFMLAGQHSGLLQELERAVEDQQKVVQMYPSSAADWYRLTELQLMVNAHSESPVGSTPEPSFVIAAQRALELDDMNHSWGHADRFLTKAQRDILESVVPDRRELRL